MCLNPYICLTGLLMLLCTVLEEGRKAQEEARKARSARWVRENKVNLQKDLNQTLIPNVAP
jgi:hypothetical protein